MNYKTFTSESVAAGHPDKICDQISDAVLDAALAIDPKSRVAVETLVTYDRTIMAGEVTCPKPIDFEKIARRVIKRLGYTNKLFHFSDKSPIDIYIHQQSLDIAVGADADGAGDQGMMFGYAVRETPEMMPLPIVLSHRLVEKMDEMRESGKLPYLRPDGKSEVKVKYVNGKPKGVEKVVLAVPHDPKIEKEQVKADLFAKVVKPVLAKYGYKIDKKDLIVNGTGRWEIGGPASDTGVTGRKIIVDSYGGMARIGGGAFSGKDPTKSGSQWCLRGSLCGEKYCRQRFGRPGGSPAGLRHRLSGTDYQSDRDFRNRKEEAGGGGRFRFQETFGFVGAGHYRGPGPKAADV